MKSITQLVEMKRIKVPKGRRNADEEKIKDIADSIKLSGLINPIAVDKDYNLVAGLHRYRAHELLGIEKIKASVYDGSTDEMKLIEIDENLMRNEISFLERGDALVERQKVYEKIYPTADKTASHAELRRKTNATIAPSFTEDTSKKTGLSQRTVQQDIQLSKNLNEDIKEKVISGELEISKNELVKISSKDDKDQKKIINRIERQDMPVKEAIESVEKKDKKKEITIKEFNKNLNAEWLKNITDEKSYLWLMIGMREDGTHVIMADKSLTMKDIKNRIEGLSKK